MVDRRTGRDASAAGQVGLSRGLFFLVRSSFEVLFKKGSVGVVVEGDSPGAKVVGSACAGILGGTGHEMGHADELLRALEVLLAAWIDDGEITL